MLSRLIFEKRMESSRHQSFVKSENQDGTVIRPLHDGQKGEITCDAKMRVIGVIFYNSSFIGSVKFDGRTFFF